MTDEPHRAARVQARYHGLLENTLTGRGWAPRLVAYAGYGTTSWVRVLARVLLAPVGETPRTGPTDLRGWRRFLSASAVGVPVTVTIGDTAHDVVSDRDGYVDVRLPAALEPGWRSVSVRSTDEPGPGPRPVRVVGPGTRLGLVSDIDDTVIVTMLPRPLVAFRNAFLLRESARTPVPGMAELYADVEAAHPDVFVVYLSTGAWNTAGAADPLPAATTASRAGPLLLTDWGPTATGWFRSGAEHKRTAAAPAARRAAATSTGCWSATTASTTRRSTPRLAAAAPGRVAGIAIRELSLGEQVVGHGKPVARDERPCPAPAAVEVCAPDGFGLRAASAGAGHPLLGRSAARSPWSRVAPGEVCFMRCLRDRNGLPYGSGAALRGEPSPVPPRLGSSTTWPPPPASTTPRRPRLAPSAAASPSPALSPAQPWPAPPVRLLPPTTTCRRTCLPASRATDKLLSRQDRHLASRFSYGVTPDLARDVRKAGGARSWFERQLKPNSIKDKKAGRLQAWWPSLKRGPKELWERQITGVEGGWEVMNNYARWSLMRRMVSQAAGLRGHGGVLGEPPARPRAAATPSSPTASTTATRSASTRWDASTRCCSPRRPTPRC